jgi:mannose-6-phosphate isomerase-like protein (cupin superfamily)
MIGSSESGPAVIPDWTATAPPTEPNKYCELLRVSGLAVGRFAATPGYEYEQDLHTEDEIYFIASGEAHLIVGTDTVPVRTGSIAYVPAGVAHRFTNIRAPLQVLVFFAAPST